MSTRMRGELVGDYVLLRPVNPVTDWRQIRLSQQDNLAKRQRAMELGQTRQRRRDVEDITGRVFGRLTALRLAPVWTSGAYAARWECRCSCGATAIAQVSRLKNGQKQSCGCLGRENLALQHSKRRHAQRRGQA